MILTCPECATGYFVDDGLIRARGRTVRCASCGHRWTAYPPAADKPLELSTSEEGAIGREPSPDAEEPAPLTADDLPRVFRGRAEEERRNRRAAMTGVIWAGAGLAILAVIGLAIVFREAVVGAWPQTASLYAGIGLPVNVTGLVIEQPRAEPGLQDGHATLVISGVIRNVTDHPVVAPPLRISILNGQGKRVAGQIATFGDSRIAPGETRHFVTPIFDPPASYASLEMEFTDRAPPGSVRATTTPGGAAPAQTPGFTLRGADNGTTPAANAAVLPATNAAAAANATAAPTNAAAAQ
jgi:predicted Zn finger-like uncharacterized protein